jgi:transposase
MAIKKSDLYSSLWASCDELIPTASPPDSRRGFPNWLISDSLPEGQEAEMMVAITITRTDLTAAELRAAAARSRDAQAARRMLAVALALEGVDRKTAAETCGMERQTLRDWVHRYNAEGLAGLSNRRGAPRSRRLDAGQVAELVSWLEAGPDPAVDGVVRWRRQDLRVRIASAFGVELHERTVGKYLATLGYRRLSVRPRHPKTDPEAQEAFKKTSPGR